MKKAQESKTLYQCLASLINDDLSPLDFLAEGSPEEKIVSLTLNGPPPGISEKLGGLFHETLAHLAGVNTNYLKVVTLGGGTGLSNIVGGDSRRDDWQETPFTGLKEIFPGITSIVCVTDDGGSTGELLKYLPLIGLGDLRHVLVSSVRREKLQERYQIDALGAKKLAANLHGIFNYRFHSPDATSEELLADSALLKDLPDELFNYFSSLVERLFSDDRLNKTLRQPQCLGNLLLASAIFSCLDPGLRVEDLIGEQELLHQATIKGLREISLHIGVQQDGVLPCTTTPAQLQMLYSNGILVTGENKSGFARRGYPVDRAIVEFCREPYLPPEVESAILEADIILCAPGSLYTSIIPILQVPGIAKLVRQNRNALKILVSNIWVQKGETDATRDAPERKFHVSDLIRAYNRNIPGGVEGLFSHIMTLGLGEIPGSILQNYALEDKEPIYLDRQRVREMGFEPVEAVIFSTEKLHRRHVIQHDPAALATTVRTLWSLHQEQFLNRSRNKADMPTEPRCRAPFGSGLAHPCQRFAAIEKWCRQLVIQNADNGNGERNQLAEPVRSNLLKQVSDILWLHPDILPEHVETTRGIVLANAKHWLRCQQWDNIYSFYDPDEKMIVIREDQTQTADRFAMAFLVALGQSLLGNYALEKNMVDMYDQKDFVGRVYRLVVRDQEDYKGFFTMEELDHYMFLARMRRSESNPRLYTRLVNNKEGFTPPGLLFGLLYTWYLDNRFAGHIEYKMSIMRNTVTDLIPEQVKIVKRREGLVDFFREELVIVLADHAPGVFLRRACILDQCLRRSTVIWIQ